MAERNGGSMRVGVIGGGQLARMMIPAAVALGIDLRVFAESTEMSAALATTAIGDYAKIADVLQFAADVDVVTFDHEHVPQEVLRSLVATGVRVHPGPGSLQFAQDKLLMRERLAELGIPTPEWARVAKANDLDSFIANHDDTAIVKMPRGGYDGKGVRLVRRSADVADWFAGGQILLAEEQVVFTRELAQLVARSPSGGLAVWPLAETVQIAGVCAEVIAPAPQVTEQLVTKAAEVAVAIAEGLAVTGVMAVELFQTSEDQVLVNELAMRPHNSGHWSMDGAVTGQFEQHLRAILDLPLGSTAVHENWTVMVNLLGGPQSIDMTSRYHQVMAAHPSVKVHNYGKQAMPGRKLGHVNCVGNNLGEVRRQARSAAAMLCP